MYKVLIKFIRFIMMCLSYILPLNVLRSLTIRTDNLFVERILVKKYLRKIGQSKEYDVVKDLEKKYIRLNSNFNKFSVFNMCYISDMLGKAALGYYPKFEVIDENGENYFSTYFKKINYDGMKEKKYHLPNCLYNSGNPHWFMNKNEIHAYHLIYRTFFQLNDEFSTDFSNECRRVQNEAHKNSGMLYGVVVRGTDYLIKKPKGHPIQPDVSDVLKKLKKNVSANDRIYLATDEKKVKIAFEEAFPNQIITSEGMYFDGLYKTKNKNIAEYRFNRENDKQLLGIEYFRKVYVLSACDTYFGGISGASRIAIIINDNKYKNPNIFNLGVY